MLLCKTNFKTCELLPSEMWPILFIKLLPALLIFKTVLAKNILRSLDSVGVEGDVQQRVETVEDLENVELEVQWPLGIVHYYLDQNDYDALAAERIRAVMEAIEDVSCLRFKALVEDQHDSPWIHITNPNGVRECVHHTTTNGTRQEIVLVLGYECMHRRDLLHSLMHALGFKDEVTHPQRDQYVRILWDNLHPAYRALFRIHYDDFPTRATEYDPMSIMHFHDRAFTKNGQATIAPLIPGLVINPARELSPLDKMKLRLMFGHECNRREVGDLLDTCKTALKDDINTNDGEGGDEGGYDNTDKLNGDGEIPEAIVENGDDQLETPVANDDNGGDKGDEAQDNNNVEGNAEDNAHENYNGNGAENNNNDDGNYDVNQELPLEEDQTPVANKPGVETKRL